MTRRILWSLILLLVTHSIYAQVMVLKGSSITVNDVRFASESITTFDKQAQQIEITVYKFPKRVNSYGQFEFDIAQWRLSVVQPTDRVQGNGYTSDTYICEDLFSKKTSTAVELRYDNSKNRVDIIVYALKPFVYNPADGSKGGYQLDPVCIIHNVDKIN